MVLTSVYVPIYYTHSNAETKLCFLATNPRRWRGKPTGTMTSHHFELAYTVIPRTTVLAFSAVLACYFFSEPGVSGFLSLYPFI
jgi:hypothetical protein